MASGPMEENVDRLKVGAVSQLDPRNGQQLANSVTHLAKSKEIFLAT